MTRHKTLFLTERSPYHQQRALASAPPELDVTMLRTPTREALINHLPQTEFLISERAGVIDGAIMAAAPQLRLIQRLGSLTHDIDLDAARARGIPVCTMPVLGSILVAEHLVMQMLTLAKRTLEVAAVAAAAGAWRASRRTDENTFAYNWSGRSNVRGLYGATVGILGFGEIGAEVARRLAAFGPAQIFYHKRTRLPPDIECELGLTYAAQGQLCAESDFLCVLLPFSPNTEMVLSAALLAHMKPGAFVVSCGSGSIIDEEALAAALRSGHLGGAALDTFEWEPLRPDNPLLPLARTPSFNVLLTPHTAAGTAPYTAASRTNDYENIQRLLGGNPLLYRIS